MEDKKREKLKTMVLFCLIFFVINYVIYNFIIIPKENDVEEHKMKYENHYKTTNIYEAKKIILNDLKEEINQLLIVPSQLEEYIIDNIDTIDMSYDFYDFSKRLNVIANTVSYELSSISYMKEEEIVETPNEVEEVNTSEYDEDYVDPMEGVVVEEVIEDISEKPLYNKVNVNLTLELDKSKLEEVLLELDNSTTQNIYVNSIRLETKENQEESSNEEENEDDNNVGSVANDSEEGGEVNSITDESTQQKDNKNLIALNIQFIAFVDYNIKDNTKEYEFYEQKERHNSINDMFSVEEKNEIN